MDLEKINAKFKVLAEKIIKYRFPILLFFILFVVFSFSGLKGIEKDSSNDAWYLENDPIIIQEKTFENNFGNSEICAVHIQVDNVFTKENLKKIRELSNELEKGVPLVDNIVSITNFEYISGTEWGIDIGDLIPEQIPADKEKLAELKQEALGKKIY